MDDSPSFPSETTVGALLLRLRGVRSQQSLADECALAGVNQGSISRWEKGKDTPSPLQFRRMVEVTHGTADDLSHGLSLITGIPVRVTLGAAQVVV